MYRLVFLFAGLVICESHAVLPVIAPVHAVPAPVLTPYINHGYTGLGFGHGHLGKSFGHHIIKRSPHVVPVGKYDHVGAVGHISGLGHVGAVGHPTAVAPVASIAPVAVAPAAVSHQARVDVRTSPAIFAVPVALKEVITPVVAPIYSKPLAHINFGGYGTSHFGHKY